MRSRGTALVLASFLVCPPAAAQTTFSSRVEAVRVDVLVTERGRIVRGLQPADFEVLDNGIPQDVELVTSEHLPLNLVMVLDMSDSVAGGRLEHLRAAGLTLLDQLGRDDEAGLVTFSHAVRILSPLTTERSKVRLGLTRAEGSGRTALVDALHTGIVLGESGVGRSLLIAFGDGVDTSSWLSPETVLEMARRTDVVIYVVSAGGGRRTDSFSRELTSLTGGSLIEIASNTDLGATFVRILDEFRQRYLISYTPRGVSGDGWHELVVRVKGRRASVQARPGYMAGKAR